MDGIHRGSRKSRLHQAHDGLAGLLNAVLDLIPVIYWTPMGNFTVDHTAKSVDHEAQEFVNFLERRNKSSGKPLRAKSSPKNPLGTEMVKSVET